MRVIPKVLLVPCSMKRVICHWSVGNYEANDVDKEAYNLLVEGDGKVIGGDHPISDNVSTADGDYAAHTKNCNTSSIGIACCAMVGCKETPFKPGPKPMKKVQWDVMVQAVAELCDFYKIPVTPTTVLGHGEVQKILGIPQNGKWDPMVWPWDTSKTRAQVGDALREQVQAALTALGNGGSGDIPLGGAAEAAPAGVANTSAVFAAEEPYLLQASLLAADPVMRDIAATNTVLTPPISSTLVPGISTIQEALNRLALNNAVIPRISFGPEDKYRGFYGPQTVKAIRAFQSAAGVGVDGAVGDDTLRALDAALNGTTPPAAAAVPSGLAVGAGGYSPPSASSDLLKNVRFDQAVKVGAKYLAKFANADASSAKSDPSKCKALLRFPDGTIYFDAKMALCVDGSPNAKKLDPDGLLETAHTIKGKPINAEKVSYVVCPRKDPNNGDNFLGDMGLKKGDLAVVIAGGKYCGAILGELGPEEKIGETSIIVHEKLQGAGSPPVGNPWKVKGKSINNVSVGENILYLIFPNTASLIASKLTQDNAEKLIQETAEQLFTKFRA